MPVNINRPLLPWDRPLQDAGWRRWFDILKEQGVDKIGGARSVKAPGMLPANHGRLSMDVLTGGARAVNPGWTDMAGYEDQIRKQTGTGRYFESHDEFKKRYGR